MPVLASDTYAVVDLPDLNEFDPTEIMDDSTIVAVGKRRTGKTWVLRNIMWEKRDVFEAGIVFSQTDELNHFWRQYIPAKYIFKKYDPAVLDQVFQRQKDILNSTTLTDQEKEKVAPFFILLDDVISDDRLKWDSNLMELFVSGRHYKLFVLITTQYAKSITPTLRGNTDYCIVMKTIQKRQLESLYEDYAGFLTKDAWGQMVNEQTRDNHVMIVNTAQDDDRDPIDTLAWWKAVDPGPFVMGSEAYWDSAKVADDGGLPPMPGVISSRNMVNVKNVFPASFGNALQGM
tara:strand:- start:1279 stop:2145 length:867 start_codon:yes stop_codon:yes gene_type:complete